MVPYSEELKAVEVYLGRDERRSKLIDFQERVKGFFRDNKENGSIHGCVQNVFSRADVDPNNPIKSAKKIAIKLHKWRQQPGSKKTLSPRDIHDICGVTVVCFYPSDLDRLLEFIEKNKTQPLFEFGKGSFKPPLQDDGYSAHHIKIVGKGRFTGLTCELQLKTILTQAWGTKTHDLTYKPSGDIDARLAVHINKLGYTLQLIDQQSEILKDLITEAWSMDVRRRKVARMHMVMSISASSSKRVRALLKHFKDHEADLATKDFSDSAVDEFEQMLNNIRENEGLTPDFCRIVGIYAVNRDSGDRNGFALDTVDELRDEIGASGNQDAYRKVIILRSVLAMALGEYPDAIESGRWVVEHDKAKNGGRPPINASANLAYFLSEASYHRYYDEAVGGGLLDTAVSKACGQEALQIVHDLEASKLPKEYEIEIRDTIGAVKICCGGTEELIKEGLAQCKLSFEEGQKSAAKDAIKAFYDLHEKRAFRRILDLSHA